MSPAILIAERCFRSSDRAGICLYGIMWVRRKRTEKVWVIQKTSIKTDYSCI